MTRIYDKAFLGQACANTVGQEPLHFSWRREGDPGRVAWFTDSCLEDALRVEAEVKVAWVLEMPSLRTDPYDFIDAHPDLFDYTVAFDTHTPDWRATESNHVVCLALGSRLCPGDRQVYPKTLRVSIIASPKREKPGYDLRHALIDAERGALDVYGQTYWRMPSDYKLMALAPYMFTVVIPSVEGITTEATNDAFLTGTVPITWGKAFNEELFDSRGCILCSDLAELQEAVRKVGASDYEVRRPYIEENFRQALELACPEDWLFIQCPYLFDEGASSQ